VHKKLPIKSILSEVFELAVEQRNLTYSRPISALKVVGAVSAWRNATALCQDLLELGRCSARYQCSYQCQRIVVEVGGAHDAVEDRNGKGVAARERQ